MLAPEDILDPRVVVPAASAVAYSIYKTLEPSSPLSVLLFLGVAPGALAWTLYGGLSYFITPVFAVYVSYWTLLITYTIAYRLSPLHPLARYPGPLLCKISKAWLAYIVARSGKTHLYVQDLHMRYGDVVRIGPNELSITHRDFISVIGPKGLPKGPYYETRAHKAGTSLNAIRDQTLHSVRRRPWARGMNSAAMKYYEELVEETVGDLMTSLKQRTTKAIDFSEWMTYFGFDFMGHMAFTHDYGLLKNGYDKEGLTPLIEHAMRDVAWVSHVPWSIDYLRHVPGVYKHWLQIKALGVQTVQKRIALGSTQRDLFYHLMDEDNRERVKPDMNLVAIDGQLAIIAGGDTTATVLSHLFHCLLRYPQYLERLRKEIDDAVPTTGSGFKLDFSKFTTMPLLNACINETLRLYPPVLSGLQRRVEAGTGGKVIGPYFIPEQTQVSFSAYTIHRDSRYFSPLTDTFWPDRWLSQEQFVLPSGDVILADEVVTDRDVFFPFSQGPTVCAGKTLALTEIRSVTCALLQTFDIKIADKALFDAWEGSLEEMFTTKRSTLPVVLSLRT